MQVTNGRQLIKLNGNGVPRNEVDGWSLAAVNDHEVKEANGKSLNGHAKQRGLARLRKTAELNGEMATAPVGQTREQSQAVRDRQLVERCLAGEVSAWSAIYRKCHNALLASIRAFLGRAGNDTNLVEEIAARTWYAVVRNEFTLLDRFDAQYGCRLTTFMSLLAKNEARLLLRSERRRKSREQAASRPEVDTTRTSNIAVLSDDEFIATLSPSERTFCSDVLFAHEHDSSEADYTRGNRWQLRHRIRTKLERYLG